MTTALRDAEGKTLYYEEFQSRKMRFRRKKQEAAAARAAL